MDPRNKTNLDPESFVAVSKSIPGLTPAISKCSFAFLICGGIPHLNISIFSNSSCPAGTSLSGILGIVINKSVNSWSNSFACEANEVTSFFLLATKSRSVLNAVSSFDDFAFPISLAALFCSAVAVSAAKIADLRSSSRERIFADILEIPRRLKALSNTSGFSRMYFMSCIILNLFKFSGFLCNNTMIKCILL